MSTSFGSRRLVVGAHYGLRDWLAQRVTSLLMALFTAAVVVQVLVPGPLDYTRWSGIFARQWMKVLTFVTVVGLQIPILVGGSVVVESIYNVPGIGQWFYAAMLQRDYTVVQGIALLTAVAVIFSNLLVDVTYAYLDPRIRYS